MDSFVLYTELFDRYSGHVEMARNDRERTVLMVGRFVSDLEQDGLSGFLYNISPDVSSPQHLWSELRDTIGALRLVGAVRSADALALLIPVLETPVSSGPTWQSFLEARGLNLNACQATLEAPRDLWTHLDEFVGGRSS
jgi:hypothetical protein